jgi:hypothetical protein
MSVWTELAIAARGSSDWNAGVIGSAQLRITVSSSSAAITGKRNASTMAELKSLITLGQDAGVVSAPVVRRIAANIAADQIVGIGARLRRSSHRTASHSNQNGNEYQNELVHLLLTTQPLKDIAAPQQTNRLTCLPAGLVASAW